MARPDDGKGPWETPARTVAIRKTAHGFAHCAWLDGWNWGWVAFDRNGHAVAGRVSPDLDSRGAMDEASQALEDLATGKLGPVQPPKADG